MKEIFREILGVLFPKRCPGCDGILRVDELSQGFCIECMEELERIEGALCMKCGKKLYDNSKEYCRDCAKMNHSFDMNRALYLYKGPIVEGMYRFKYSNRRQYADVFVKDVERFLMDFLNNIQKDGAIDGIVPIPMNQSSVRKRGYNQAEAIAERVSELIDVPVYKNLVLRNKSTKKMKTLDPVERRLNLINAFKYHETGVKLKKILLVDDIYTTGATMDSVSTVLKDHGVKEIYSICVCIGSDQE
ncbi:MAG: ComF family protein [Lachnospiraceae bacterium]|nr:ComF family protein [Lachnospiraceae bacterium]